MTDLLLENTDTMMKLEVQDLHSLDIFALNPTNVRNWDAYSLTAKIIDERLRFIADSKQAPSQLQEFVDSLIVYEDSEEFEGNIAVVSLIEPLLVAPKNEGGQYILLSGNSRITLIRNMIEAYLNDLSAEDQQRYSLHVNPIRYETKKGYKPSDLLVLQLTANSAVPLDSWQKAQLVIRRINELQENEPDKYAGSGKAQTGALQRQICSEFGFSVQAYSQYKNLGTKVDKFFIKLLQDSVIRNVEVASKAQAILDHKVLGQDLNAQALWLLIDQQAKKDGLFFASTKTVEKVKKGLETEYKTIDSDESAESDESGESTETESSDSGETESSKNETKLAEIARLRELERDQLNEETANKILELVEALTEIDPGKYDQDGAIKLCLMASEIAGRFQNVKTEAQKALIKAEKDAAKEAAKAAKQDEQGEQSESEAHSVEEVAF